jgi:hypothetical protein
MKMKNDAYQYDVIFSLAGEQADYVEKVAKCLTDEGVKVWFYKFNEVELWGENQIDAFSEIFTKSAKYCVLFISKEYTKKVWPNLERQFIQSRWLKDPKYLLPARFDDSLVIGIPDTIGYINLKNLSPEKFSKTIINKISGIQHNTPGQTSQIRLPKTKRDFDPLEVRNEWIFSIIENLEDRSQDLDTLSITHDEIEGIMHIRVSFKRRVIYSLNIYKKAYTPGDDGISFYGVEGEIRVSGNATNASGNFEWNKDKDSVVLNLLDMSLFGIIPGNTRKLTKEEFINELWNKICDIIERDY